MRARPISEFVFKPVDWLWSARLTELVGPQILARRRIRADHLVSHAAGEAAARIRASHIQVELGAALEQWGTRLRKAQPGGRANWQRLLDVARAADPTFGTTSLEGFASFSTRPKNS
jgi:hypothetical protein